MKILLVSEIDEGSAGGLIEKNLSSLGVNVVTVNVIRNDYFVSFKVYTIALIFARLAARQDF